MGRSKLKHHKADSMTVAEEEQRVVSVITNLLTVHVFCCHGKSARPSCVRDLLAMLHSRHDTPNCCRTWAEGRGGTAWLPSLWSRSLRRSTASWKSTR
jgi:hypothetical protein